MYIYVLLPACIDDWDRVKCACALLYYNLRLAKTGYSQKYNSAGLCVSSRNSQNNIRIRVYRVLESWHKLKTDNSSWWVRIKTYDFQIYKLLKIKGRCQAQWAWPPLRRVISVTLNTIISTISMKGKQFNGWYFKKSQVCIIEFQLIISFLILSSLNINNNDTKNKTNNLIKNAMTARYVNLVFRCRRPRDMPRHTHGRCRNEPALKSNSRYIGNMAGILIVGHARINSASFQLSYACVTRRETGRCQRDQRLRFALLRIANSKWWG